jgi:hypothetical protein
MGHSLNDPFGLIQSHRDFRRLHEQLREFFLKFAGMPFHGKSPDRVKTGLQTAEPRVPYHKFAEYLY